MSVLGVLSAALQSSSKLVIGAIALVAAVVIFTLIWPIKLEYRVYQTKENITFSTDQVLRIRTCFDKTNGVLVQAEVSTRTYRIDERGDQGADGA